MKKIVLISIALFLVISLTSCAITKNESISQTNSNPSNSSPTNSAPNNSTPTNSTPDDESEETSTGNTITDAYIAYIEAKSELSTVLTEALSSNSGTELESLSLLSVAMIDLAILPASFMGLGQEAAEAGLNFIGAADVQYSENGNQYTISYKTDEGDEIVFTGEYDDTSDSFSCEVVTNDQDGVSYEYRKTSFGYVGQIYSFEGDTVTETIQIVIHENGGVIGLSSEDVKPNNLTGNETKDFPKSSTQWYSIDGTTFTGISSNGEDISFEYNP